MITNQGFGKYTYNSAEFEKEFCTDANLARLEKMFGKNLRLQFDSSYRYSGSASTCSPRELELYPYFCAESLWYINFLLETNPSKVIDMGCGGNVFKWLLGELYDVEVIGYDPEHVNADFEGKFDSTFIAENKNNISAFIATNSLHFIPVTRIADRVLEVYDVLAKGGRAYITLNVDVVTNHTPHAELIRIFGSLHCSQKEIRKHIIDECMKLNLNYLVADVYDVNENGIDGNIRLVFERT